MSIRAWPNAGRSGPTESYPHAGRPIGPPVGTHPLLELRKLSAARDVVSSVIKPTIWRDSHARVGVRRGSFSPTNRLSDRLRRSAPRRAGGPRCDGAGV